jgi:hypothetical protein
MNSTTAATIAYDNESRVPNVIAMVAGTLAIGTMTTVARFYTRYFIIKSLGIDDWFALFSQVSPSPAAMVVPMARCSRLDSN